MFKMLTFLTLDTAECKHTWVKTHTYVLHIASTIPSTGNQCCASSAAKSNTYDSKWLYKGKPVSTLSAQPEKLGACNLPALSVHFLINKKCLKFKTRMFMINFLHSPCRLRLCAPLFQVPSSLGVECSLHGLFFFFFVHSAEWCSLNKKQVKNVLSCSSQYQRGSRYMRNSLPEGPGIKLQLQRQLLAVKSHSNINHPLHMQDEALENLSI